MTGVRALGPAEVARRHGELAAFEHAFVYPLGTDRFHIDHGRDYLAFFRTLGEPCFYVAEAHGRIAGVLAAVRRRIAGRDVHYLCDLKADRAAAGAARGLLAAFAREHLGAETAAFGISMNAADGTNRLAQIARRCPAAAPLTARGLGMAPLLTRELGPVRFCDQRGKKDIVLASTGAPMPLLHAQHGPLARTELVDARPGSVHMICLPAGDALVAELGARGATPAASATLLSRHLDWFDARWVLTSDI
jgi:hypothetical protein